MGRERTERLPVPAARPGGAPASGARRGRRATRLRAPRANGGIRSSRSGRSQLREDLRRALASDGVRKVDQFAARYAVGVAAWPIAPVDPFFNINTPEQAAEADRIAAQYPEI